MEWLLGLAILPVVLCGLMCIGVMAFAAIGARRAAARRLGGDEATGGGAAAEQQASAER